jgi:hypothetical protein
MDNNISHILKKHSDVESFRAALCGRGGEFEFNTESMIEFGETYCSLYPDSLAHSDSDGVVAGYRLVRVCVVEVLLSIIPENLRELYRKMFADVNSVSIVMDELKSLIGADEAMKIHESLDNLIKDIKSHVDNMPNGVPKERFIGGISVFFNILYLMKKRLKS